MSENNEFNSQNGMIGTCMRCGIVVTEENLGETKPKVICANCKAELEEEARLAQLELERRQKEALEREARENEEAQRRREEAIKAARKASITRLCLANGVALAIVVALGILGSGGVKAGEELYFTIGLACIYTFVASLFYPGSWTRGVFVLLAFKGFNLPFIIFDFDLDGCLMFIAFKLLGWLLGLILGILGFILALVIAIVISPVVWLVLTIRNAYEIATGRYPMDD